jgi:hypothetical protein
MTLEARERDGAERTRPPRRPPAPHAAGPPRQAQGATRAGAGRRWGPREGRGLPRSRVGRAGAHSVLTGWPGLPGHPARRPAGPGARSAASAPLPRARGPRVRLSVAIHLRVRTPCVRFTFRAFRGGLTISLRPRESRKVAARGAHRHTRSFAWTPALRARCPRPHQPDPAANMAARRVASILFAWRRRCSCCSPLLLRVRTAAGRGSGCMGAGAGGPLQGRGRRHQAAPPPSRRRGAPASCASRW